MDDATRALGAAGAKLPLAGFVLDLGGEVLRDAAGRELRLRPRAWAVLRHLALAAGRLVTKDELLGAVWPGVVVTDASIAQAVSEVRDALGDAGHRVIKTVPRRGYMLVADSLVRPTTGAASEPIEREADRPSIAVLAFGSPADERSGDLLARGFALDLAAELARNADLRVASHYSSFAFSGTDLPLAEIGRRLCSRFLVGGRVRRDSETLRVDVELIDSASGKVVWASQHRIEAGELAALQDALVRRIAASLQRKARDAERYELARSPKTIGVYELTVRGILNTTLWHADAVQDGRQALEQALSIDPNYAPAWSYLGFANSWDIAQQTYGYGVERVGESLAQFQRALSLDPFHVPAYRMVRLPHRLRRDFDASLAAAQRAVELAPSNESCLAMLASVLMHCGRPREALEICKAATPPGAPLAGWVASTRAMVLWANGYHEDSLRSADESIARLPHLFVGRQARIYALAELGRLDEARREAATLLAQIPRRTATFILSGYADPAVELRERIGAICSAVGIPP